jgi:hypothetical protein
MLPGIVPGGAVEPRLDDIPVPGLLALFGGKLVGALLALNVLSGRLEYPPVQKLSMLILAWVLRVLVDLRLL